MNPSQLSRVNVNLLATKCKSKKEVYNFLAQDCGAFLPSLQSTNIYFLKEILRGTKNVSTSCQNNVKVSAVPQIEGLTVQDFIDYAQDKQDLLSYLPEERDWIHIDRHWLCDILYTLDEEGIQEKINDAMVQRKNKLEQSPNSLLLQKNASILAVNFVDEIYIDENGKSVNLLKGTSKRKRRRYELEDVKEEEQKLKTDKQEYLFSNKKLRIENQQLQDQLIELQQMAQEIIQGQNIIQLNERQQEFVI